MPAALPTPSTASACYLFHDGQTTGPYTQEQILAAWNRDELTLHACYWSEGMETWAPIAELIIAALKAEALAELEKSDAEVIRLKAELRAAQEQIKVLKAELERRMKPLLP